MHPRPPSDARHSRALATGWRGALGLTLLAGALGAQGAEFAVTPKLLWNNEFNTNRLLRAADTPDVLGAQLELGALLEAANERSRLDLTPRLRRGQYDEDIGLNTTDYFLDLGAEHDFSERWQARLDGRFSRDSTLTSEAEDEGLVFRSARRTETALMPSLTHRFDARNRFELTGNRSDVAYGEGAAGFSDYRFQSLGGAWTHAFGERDEVSLSAFHSRFDSFDTDNTSRNVGLQTGWQRLWSDRLSASVGVGVIWSELEFVTLFQPAPGLPLARAPDERSEQGLLADFSLNRRWERTSARLGYSHRISPTGRGAQTTVDELVANAEHRLLERLTGRIDLRWLREDFGDTGEQVFDRDRLRGEVSVNWRLSQFWSLSGGYAYTREERAFASGEADAHRVMLGIRYGGERRAVSR